MKPCASMSLDLDNAWSYLKIHGDPGWERYPSYLDFFIPFFLDLLDRYKLTITFFVVGRDAADPRNAEALGMLAGRGHEVGNHSLSHEPWFHLYGRERLRREVLEAEEHIHRATGARPAGFRGPGYSWSPRLFELLAQRGYRYDASLLPTSIGPLARRYYFRKSGLPREEMARRSRLLGSFSDGLRPVKSFLWRTGNGESLLEIPVTTMPGLKLPFHLSYLLFLSRYSRRLALAWLKTGLALCRISGTQPSFIFHPLDLLDAGQVPELRFFPGMDLPGEEKLRMFDLLIGEIRRHYTLVGMGEHAGALLRGGRLKSLACSPSPGGDPGENHEENHDENHEENHGGILGGNHVYRRRRAAEEPGS
ncbi:MAG: polysaccharide deacetylase family protein [Spirochaetota bacterium]